MQQWEHTIEAAASGCGAGGVGLVSHSQLLLRSPFATHGFIGQQAAGSELSLLLQLQQLQGLNQQLGHVEQQQHVMQQHQQCKERAPSQQAHQQHLLTQSPGLSAVSQQPSVTSSAQELFNAAVRQDAAIPQKTAGRREGSGTLPHVLQQWEQQQRKQQAVSPGAGSCGSSSCIEGYVGLVRQVQLGGEDGLQQCLRKRGREQMLEVIHQQQPLATSHGAGFLDNGAAKCLMDSNPDDKAIKVHRFVLYTSVPLLT
jgi:hypothetical protein